MSSGSVGGLGFSREVGRTITPAKAGAKVHACSTRQRASSLDRKPDSRRSSAAARPARDRRTADRRRSCGAADRCRIRPHADRRDHRRSERLCPGRRAVRPFRLDLRTSRDRRDCPCPGQGHAARSDRLWRRLPDLPLARDPARRALCQRDRARRRRGDRAAPDARAGVWPRSRRHCRHRVSRCFGSTRDAAGACHRGPRRLSHRLGIDRSCALQLLGRPARRGRAVLARLSASVQLLRPARLLDALAPPRSGPLRQGAGAPAPRARRQGHQLRRRKSDRVQESVACLSRSADRRGRRPHPGRLNPRRRHRARRRHPASLQEGGASCSGSRTPTRRPWS